MGDGASLMNQGIREAEDYPDLTPAIKGKILGLNAARIYGISPTDVRCGIAGSETARIKQNLDDEFGKWRWAFQEPVIHTRREFFRHLAFHRAAKLPG